MKKSRAIAALLALFVTLPIWFYLLHSILTYVEATDLEWFLYWTYLPVTMLCTAIIKITED